MGLTPGGHERQTCCTLKGFVVKELDTEQQPASCHVLISGWGRYKQPQPIKDILRLRRTLIFFPCILLMGGRRIDET